MASHKHSAYVDRENGVYCYCGARICMVTGKLWNLEVACNLSHGHTGPHRDTFISEDEELEITGDDIERDMLLDRH